MRITIVAVGQRQPAWADAAVKEYLSRLPAEFKVELKQVKAEPRTGNVPLARLLSVEAARVRAAVPSGSWLIALDERARTGRRSNWPITCNAGATPPTTLHSRSAARMGSIPT